MVQDPRIRELATRITRDLASQGRLIEAGWQAYRLACLQIPPHEARDDLREAFESGAAHLFASIIDMLDPEAEETPGDLKRMDAIAAEVARIDERTRLKYGAPAGRG